jgi:hypothetical protein
MESPSRLSSPKSRARRLASPRLVSFELVESRADTPPRLRHQESVDRRHRVGQSSRRARAKRAQRAPRRRLVSSRAQPLSSSSRLVSLCLASRLVSSRLAFAVASRRALSPSRRLVSFELVSRHGEQSPSSRLSSPKSRDRRLVVVSRAQPFASPRLVSFRLVSLRLVVTRA